MGAVISEANEAAGAPRFRALRRQLSEVLTQQTSSDVATPLEAQRVMSGEPPRLARAEVLEGSAIQRHAVEGTPEPGVFAFLDGLQASRVLVYDAAIPIVHGSVASVVRLRRDRRMTT